MFRHQLKWMMLAVLVAGCRQSGGNKVEAPARLWTDQDEATIRSQLAKGFEVTWNSHQPAAAATSDKSIDGARVIDDRRR
jgi:hypothetical protein